MALRGAGCRAGGSNAPSASAPTAAAAFVADALAPLERYRERFAAAIENALHLARAGQVAGCREALIVLGDACGRSVGERALCRALLALTSVALGDDDAARRYSRQALGACARHRGRPPEYEQRYLRAARALLAALAARRRSEREPKGPLTATEITILELVSGGYSAPEIATLMGRSAHTVRTHIRNAGGKLEAHGRLGTVRRARQLGLLPNP